MGTKVNPFFGNPGDDPSSISLLQNLKMNVDALMRWAKLMEVQFDAVKSILKQQEDSQISTSIEVLSSIEAICQILKSSGIDLDEFNNLQNSFKEVILLEREKALEAQRQFEMESKNSPPEIWLPNKKIIPGK